MNTKAGKVQKHSAQHQLGKKINHKKLNKSIHTLVDSNFDSPTHKLNSNPYQQQQSLSQHYNYDPSQQQQQEGGYTGSYGNKSGYFHQSAKKRGRFRARIDRDDPLTSLLSTLSFSYLGRTAADKEVDNRGVEAQSDLHKAAASKLKRQKKANKKLASSAIDLQEQSAQNMSQLRSNIISAEAVTKTIHNVFRQHNIEHKGITSFGLQRLLEQPNSPFSTIHQSLDANGEPIATTFDSLQQALLRTQETVMKKHALSHGEEGSTDDDPQNNNFSNKIHALSLKKRAKKSVNGEDIDNADDNSADISSTVKVGTESRQQLRARRQKLLDSIKKDVPDLQKNVFNELDGIVEFANLHYDNALQALSKHSLSSLYPPELLAVEFFDYRLELFLDAVAEDLGALYKAKRHFFVKHLQKLLDSQQISQIEHMQLMDKLNDLFNSTKVLDLKQAKSLFATINFDKELDLNAVYADQDLGFTSYDTTFVRNLDNTLDNEITLVEEMHKAITEDIFSIKKFESALNLSAQRYPGLNVPIEKYIEQLSLEHQSITNAVDEYTELTENLTKMGRASQLSPLQDHVLRWFKPLSESIDAEINLIKNNAVVKLGGKEQEGSPQQTTSADVKMIIPYIQLLQSTELGCIALHETLSRILNAPNGLRVIDLALAIGKVVNTEANLHKLRQDRNNWQRLRRYYPGAKLNEQVIRRAVNNHNQKQDIDPNGAGFEDNTVWSDLIQAKIGSFLIKHMLSSSSIRQIVDPNTGTLSSVDRQFTKENLSAHEIEVPAFVYEHRQVGNNFVGYLTSHADVRNVLEKAHTDVQTLSIRLLPMVIPPRPWRGTRDGGYLSVPSSVIRSKGSRKQVTAVENSNIESVFQSLNYLGRVSWGINHHVLSTIDQAWEEGGGFAAMPSRRDIPAPPQPVLNLLQYDEKLNRYFAPNQPQQANVNPEQLAQQTTQWRQWQRDTQRISQYNADLHSLRCDLQLRLNQARQLSENPVYFPLNMDFRGRTYPIPPHLNHLGSDLARALLVFHNRKPLGPKGLYWLKAHLAAQFGVDKVSFDDRVKFIEEHLELVRDTAQRPFYPNVKNPHFGKLRSLDEALYPVPREVQHKYARVYIRQQLELESTEQAKAARLKQLLNDYTSQGLHLDMSIEDDPAECVYPLDGERDVRAKLPWWQTADSPWQALATCKEICAAIDSGNPETYETGLPVHQDGSCNGLQHYAALGRDYQGGSRVNLTNSDKPQDVYSHVLHEVKRRMELDAENTNNPLAKMLLPFMNRKVVKQTVMTSVYGVTFIGARDQILKQLRDLKDVPWDQASDLVVQQQVENRKKFLQKQSDMEIRKKQRDRAKLLKNMTEQQRIEFLNNEMMEQGMQDDAVLNDLIDEYDQSRKETLQGVTVEGHAPSEPVSTPTPAQGADTDAQILISQRQAQEAAMRASSIYLARLTLTSLGTVFSAATRIMSWLTECAGIISKHEQPVSWITPLQLPVVQHYRLISKYQVKTLNQTVTLHHDNDSLPVSPQRQRAAFPPNFVHSLDATHMMLTSMQCAKHGLVFSSVHDSYWTHPGDVDKMNALLRDQFITLYSQPILEDLRESFVLRYPTAEFPPVPERGDLDLEEVRQSNYFFN